MTRRKELLALAHEVREGAASRELDAKVAAKLRRSLSPPDYYTTSIDAAMTLVPEGWEWDVSGRSGASGVAVYLHSPDRTKWGDAGGFAATPAQALTTAALRAIAEGEPHDQ